MPLVGRPRVFLELVYLDVECRSNNTIAKGIAFCTPHIVQTRELEVEGLAIFLDLDFFAEINLCLIVHYENVAHKKTHAWTLND